MFTGIVQAMGRIQELTRKGDDARLRVDVDKLDLSTVEIGDSISVSGVCLTVIAMQEGMFSADVSAETMRCTTLGELRPGDRVNLEKSLTLATPLGGHLVSGHVDDVAEVKMRDEVGQSLRYVIAAPASLARYIAAKGSVCIDGVSLTVNEVRDADFEVNIVPHTLRETTLGSLASGDRVNLEVDLMARYVERLLRGDRPEQCGPVREALQGAGFINE